LNRKNRQYCHPGRLRPRSVPPQQFDDPVQSNPGEDNEREHKTICHVRRNGRWQANESSHLPRRQERQDERDGKKGSQVRTVSLPSREEPDQRKRQADSSDERSSQRCPDEEDSDVRRRVRNHWRIGRGKEACLDRDGTHTATDRTRMRARRPANVIASLAERRKGMQKKKNARDRDERVREVAAGDAQRARQSRSTR